MNSVTVKQLEPMKGTHGGSSLAAMFLVLQLLASPSFAEVSVFPSDVVAALGSHAAFTCVSTSIHILRVEWLINGTSLNDGHRSDGVIQERDIILQFSNVPSAYNNTRIRCRGDNVTSSHTTILLVQGLLAAVGSLLVDGREDHIYVNWTAPFTLDITATRVDITYCVDVVSSTSSTTLHSECGITETEFTYHLPPRSWCHEYNFTVTPVNVVGNGTATSIDYTPHLNDSELVQTSTTSTTVSFLMSAPVCEAELVFEDVHARTVYTTRLNDLTIERNTITFSSQMLTANREYRVIISASNVRSHAWSETVISTHDIVSSSIIQDENGITVLVNFTEHSEATGALLNFIFINEDGATIDFSKSFGHIVEKHSISQSLILPLTKFCPGQYMLYVYDIESDKRIMDGLQYHAISSNLTVVHGQGNIPLPQSQNIISSHGGVITVVFPFSRFQVTAQRNTLDSVNILHVNTSMDPQTPVTLQVTENGEYLVTILPVQDGRGILSGLVFSQIHTVTNEFTPTQNSHTTIPVLIDGSSQSEITIGLIGGLVCVSFLSAVLAIALLIQCHKQRPKIKVELNQPPADVGVAMSPDGGETAETQMYEEIKEPASAPPTQRPANPAPRVPLPALVPQYEDVEISAASNTIHSYQITTCAAYGVTHNS